MCKSPTLGKLCLYGSNGLPLEQWVDEHCCFTINSLVFDLAANRLLCCNQALSDLENRVIRASSRRPIRSFGPHIELRAVRLALTSPDFTIAEETLLDLRSARTGPCGGSARAAHEFGAILESADYRRGLGILEEIGILRDFESMLYPAGESNAAGESLLALTTPIFDAIDGILSKIGPVLSESLPEHPILLRLAALVAARPKAEVRRLDTDSRKQFLKRWVGQTEAGLRDFGFSQMRAFRVAFVAAVYLDAGGSAVDPASTQQAIQSSVARFGRWKGALSALLTWADALASGVVPEADADGYPAEIPGSVTRGPVKAAVVDGGL